MQHNIGIQRRVVNYIVQSTERHFYNLWTVILILHISEHVSQNTALCTDTYEILFSSLKNVTFSVT
jgi:Na+-transporting methylmalonyl-CoA/oxaloacetate decarboxylase beta subunit